jgi:hypothetical protein
MVHLDLFIGISRASLSAGWPEIEKAGAWEKVAASVVAWFAKKPHRGGLAQSRPKRPGLTDYFLR